MRMHTHIACFLMLLTVGIMGGITGCESSGDGNEVVDGDNDVADDDVADDGHRHADDDEEFVTVMNSLLNNEASVHNLAQKKRRDFLQDYLGLDTMHHDRTANIRFTELLKDMIVVNPTTRSSMK